MSRSANFDITIRFSRIVSSLAEDSGAGDGLSASLSAFSVVSSGFDEAGAAHTSARFLTLPFERFHVRYWR
jgi:hypothetical protein